MLAHSVRIKIDGGNEQILHPGQIITGTVEYKAPAGECVVSLTIDLRGVTKILPKKGSSLNTEFVEMFHMGENLLSGSYFWTNPGERHIYDFSFVLPTLTGPDRSSLYSDAGNVLFEERVHALPPSMEDGLSPEVKIEYNMYAVAKEQCQAVFGGMAQENLETRPVVHNLEHLRLIPDVEHVDYGDRHRYEKTFAPLDAPLTPQRRFSWAPGSSNSNKISPFQSFTLVADVPSTVVMGENVEIGLAVDYAERDTETQYSHKLTTLTMQARTHRRTTKVPHEPALTSVALMKMDARKAIKQMPTLPSTPLKHNFSTDTLLKLPPTFKSYHISREYYLLLDVTLIGKGKKEFNTQWVIPVQLVYRAGQDQIMSRRASMAPPPPPPPPPIDTEVMDVVGHSSPVVLHQRRGVEDDLPPAYQPRPM